MDPLLMRNHFSLGSINCLPRNALHYAAGEPQVRRMDTIKSQAEALACLESGGMILGYRGYDSICGKRLPKPGTEITSPFVDKNERHQADGIEVLIERTRVAQFPHVPSRMDAVFVATSVLQAKKWGTVGIFGMRLREGAPSSQTLPLSWMDGTVLTRIYRLWRSLTPTDLFGMKQARADTALLASEEGKKLAIAYLECKGSHDLEESELLVDPAQVEVMALGALSSCQGYELHWMAERLRRSTLPNRP